MAVVAITGSSTGIGMATALALARAGHRVFATMRSPESSALARALAAEPLPVRLLPLDVDRDDSVREAFARIEEEAGTPDVLVNNAGIAQMRALEDAPLELFRAIMETNFFGALRTIHAVLPGMRRRASGAIVNVTSVAGRIAIAAHAPYCASKWALEAASESLAQEVKAFGIRVAIVEPGVIATPIFGKAEPSGASAYPHERRLMALFDASLRRPVPPETVAEAIRGIVESGTWQLRHPVGPDAAPFLSQRASLTDEQWIDFAALSDDAWREAVRERYGLEVDLAGGPSGL